MTERFIPDHRTPTTTSAMRDALVAAWPELTFAGGLLSTAHWHFETGGGASMHCFNVGNAKCRAGDGRIFTMYRCSEYVKGVLTYFDPPHPQTRFRAFDSLEAGVADHVSMMKHNFGGALEALEAGDPIRFAVMLKLGRYYTDDTGHYAAAICSRLEQVQRELGDECEIVQPSIESALLRIGFGGDGFANAVMQFQQAAKLVVDGVAGPKTIGAVAKKLEVLTREA